MLEKFLTHRRQAHLDEEERQLLEDAVSEVREIAPREVLIEAHTEVKVSTYLIEGFLSRFIEDWRGMKQLVAIHLSGEFVDLHAYPMGRLDHSVAAISRAKVATVPHSALRDILDPRPELARKLWFSTLTDAALHRAWLFRVGRLDAVGRLAHFLSEMNVRMIVADLSDGTSFTMPLRQTDIAEICGLTPVHTNRSLKQLREAGLCTVRGSRVTIHDPESLARRGNFEPRYLYFDATQLPEAYRQTNASPR